MEAYTPEQHRLLMDAAAEVLFATLMADRSGPVGYFEEMTAAGTFLYEARRRYPDNRLVQDLYAHANDKELELDEDVLDQDALLERISEVGRVLRHDDEGDAFRRFLVELAERVAYASRHGLFGKRISDDEAAFLAELRRRLDVKTG